MKHLNWIVNFVFCILSWKPKTVCRPVSSVEAKILRIHVQRLLSLWSQLHNRWATVAYGLDTCSFLFRSIFKGGLFLGNHFFQMLLHHQLWTWDHLLHELKIGLNYENDYISSRLSFAQADAQISRSADVFFQSLISASQVFTYLHVPPLISNLTSCTPLISKLKASGEKRKGNRAHKLEAKAVLLLVWHLWSRPMFALTLSAADIYWIFAETLAGCTGSST